MKQEVRTETLPAVNRDHLPSESRGLSIERCATVVEWWARQLGLTHWTIDVLEFHRAEHEGSLGWCSFNLAKLRATIGFMRISERHPDDDLVDSEQVAVHELIHLLFASWQEWTMETAPNRPGWLKALCEEQPTEKLSWALVTMRRANDSMRFDWERPVSGPGDG